MNLRKLLLVNAVFTFAGGVILFAVPSQIMSAVGVHIDPSAYFVYYLLGASALSFAVLSYRGRTLRDANALQVVALTFFVFHAASAGVSVYAVVEGLSTIVWVNTSIHVVFSALFAYYGFVRPPEGASSLAE